MCGIFGFTGSPDHELLGRMAAVLLHRGPDDGGAFERAQVSLGHRRLSIIDRAGGHQPLANEDETVWLVYNGEVYNYRELRSELEAAGHVFRSSGDSEVIVHAYEQWGPGCAARFNGMWSFAIADLREPAGKLVLCRDHFGIKPLFYARSPHTGRLLFASEIKSLLQDPDLTARPDEQMIFEYLQHGFHDHRAETFFAGVYHVPAASWIELPLAAGPGQSRSGLDPVTRPDSGPLTAPLAATAYWTPALRSDGSADPGLFRHLFRSSVERRLVSEVPVGSCLSGGLDSTTIVAFMSELLKDEVPDAASLRGQLKTFSAVFDGDPIDERAFIEVAVESTGADTTYTNPTSPAFVDELRDFIWHQEEPIVSTGPYAQWCVMRSAREQVTVLLDGQGGDELIAGYVPYQLVYLRQLRKQKRYAELRREAAASRDVLWPLARRRLGQRHRRLATRELLQPGFLDRVVDPGYGRTQDDLKQRLLQDLLTYSLPCLLRYEDRNSMAFSIESRVPYLDQEFVDHILRLPDTAIVRDGWSRWILRAALKGTLPEKIRLRRWKVGFTTPEMRWIKARRAVFTSLYQSPSFQARPYWDGAAVVSAFRACCRGEVEESMFFWRAANVELWLREFCDRSVVVTGVDVEAALTAPASVGVRRRGSVAAGGDELVPALLLPADGSSDARAGADSGSATAEAERLLADYEPNALKHLFAARAGRVYARLPLKTDLVGRGDSLEDLFRRQVVARVKPGDIVVMAEKPIAASQGRSFALDEIQPTRLARGLSRAVTRTPHGIGLGVPETMQLAIDEAGTARILAATAAAAAGKLVRRKGWFYRVAGSAVEAIDGPTANTLPPHNTQAKLGPADPDGVAAKLAQFVSDEIGGGVGMAVIDANDLTAKVLGASPGVDRDLVNYLMRDNPLGQGHEQTPVCLLRDMGPLTRG
jgi:asparagine synthase (glutamine-hydrolysing)